MVAAGGNRNRALSEVALDAVDRYEIVVLCKTTAPAPNLIHPFFLLRGEVSGNWERRGKEGGGGGNFSESPIEIISSR